MDPVQQLYEQLNCNSAEQLDFNNCYIDERDVSSVKLVGSDTYGALSKRWYFINGRKCLVKGNSLLGQEPFAEVLASNLARVLNIKHISYTLMDASLFKDVTMNGDFKYVSVCEFYPTKLGTCRITLHDILADKFSNYNISSDEMYKSNYIPEILELDSTILHKLFSLLHFDSLIGNIDRHCTNIEFEMDTKTLELVDIIPIFDCGDSLYHMMSNDFLRDRSKPIRFTHDEQMNFIMEQGYIRDTFNVTSSTFYDWEDLSEGVFKLMDYNDVLRVKEFLRRRLRYYGNI